MNQERTSSGLLARGVQHEYAGPSEPVVVLRGVDFSLTRGEALVIAGPSGSGKTTLLNLLGTLVRPTGGEIRFDDLDPFALPPAELAAFRGRQVGFVFQDHHLLPQCTAFENILVGALAQGTVGTAEEGRARDLLRRVGLADRAEHLPAELSGGQQQRLALARALINRPGLLLADEPTGNLDGDTAARMGELLVELVAEGETMLVLATHDRELASRFPQRQLLREGKLVTERNA